MLDSINITVAAQLKKARSDKGWSLDVASQHCDVSKAMLGQIERGESSPTIARLWKIATGFKLPLSYFLGQQDSKKSNEPKCDEVHIETVFEYEPDTRMEMFALHLPVGYEQYSDPHQTGVTEHIVVVKGSIQYFVDDQWKTLNVGEKVKFAADKQHGYRNAGEAVAEFFNIIHYI